MDLTEFAKRFPQKMQKIRDFVESDDLKDVMGVEATNHFQESFDNEGFTDESLQPWQDVKRRDKESPWYGHNSGGTKKNRFSAERTEAKILRGKSRHLRNSIFYKHTDTGVRITSPTPYGRVHQFGLGAKVYGKKSFQMPARPFMGKSKVLKGNIEKKIVKEIINIIKE